MKSIKALMLMLVISSAAVVLPASAANSGADIFASKCAMCHGANGQGTPGLAPALKGDPFVTKGSIKEIENTIQHGRAGAQKKYKNLPTDMPAHDLSAADLKALVGYLRGDLQKK